MNKCVSTGIYESLSWCDGKTVLPGIKPRAYFIKKSDIVSWPKLPDLSEAKAMGELATYAGNFVLAADKKWQTLDGLSNKGTVDCEQQGEKPSRTFLNKGSLKHPGVEAEAAGFCRQAVSDNLVYLVQQRNGKFRVLGSNEFDSDTKIKQSLGEGVTGDAGTTLEIESTDVCPAPFYPGKIETDDGDLSGADGSAWIAPSA